MITRSETCWILLARSIYESIYRQTFLALEQSEVLKKRRSYAEQLLIAMDGTEYFSSKKIHCENCNHRELSNGKTNYFHSVLTPVIVQPGNETVISLEPEFIVPQDGHEKQDCEIQAAKRWVEKQGEFYAKRGVTILGDDLFSRQPFCLALKDKHFHFILVCKPDSHTHLYQTRGFSGCQSGVRHESNPAMGWKVRRDLNLSLCQPTALVWRAGCAYRWVGVK